MGGKSRLVMDMTTAAEFHDKLTEFSEHYSALGKSFNCISGIILSLRVFSCVWYYGLFFWCKLLELLNCAIKTVGL